MPVYEFKCEKCGKITELITILSEPDTIVCLCGEQAKRIISITNFILKGNGWGKDGYNK